VAGFQQVPRDFAHRPTPARKLCAGEPGHHGNADSLLRPTRLSERLLLAHSAGARSASKVVPHAPAPMWQVRISQTRRQTPDSERRGWRIHPVFDVCQVRVGEP